MYASEYIPVMPNATYTKNNIYQYAVYDKNKIFISGAMGQIQVAIPSNGTFIRVCCTVGELNNFQVELGTNQTTYQSYLNSILKEQVVGINPRNCVVVAKSGGEYTTITDAINNNRCDIDNPLTIFLMSGIYVEPVDIRQKYISIIGFDKLHTIIQSNTGDYYSPPLNASSNFYIANITFIATNTDGGSPTLPSYAMHCDRTSVGEGLVFNCTFISYVNCAVGVGLQDQQKLTFEHCEFYSYTQGKESFFAHNYQLSGATNQKLILKNCKGVSKYGYAIKLEDANNESGGASDNIDTVFSFYNNMFYSEELGKTNITNFTPSMGAGDIGYIKISGDSFGNNISQLNK
jgi:hypothetical protein